MRTVHKERSHLKANIIVLDQAVPSTVSAVPFEVLSEQALEVWVLADVRPRRARCGHHRQRKAHGQVRVRVCYYVGFF